MLNQGNGQQWARFSADQLVARLQEQLAAAEAKADRFQSELKETRLANSAYAPGNLEAVVNTSARIWRDTLIGAFQYASKPTTLGAALAPKLVRLHLEQFQSGLPKELGYIGKAADSFRHLGLAVPAALDPVASLFAASITTPIEIPQAVQACKSDSGFSSLAGSSDGEVSKCSGAESWGPTPQQVSPI